MNQCRVLSELNAYEIRQADLDAEYQERYNMAESRYGVALKELKQGRKLETHGKTFSLFEDIDQTNHQLIGDLEDDGKSVWDEYVNNCLPADCLAEVNKHAESLAKKYIELSFGVKL